MSTQNPERNVASDSPSTCGSCDSAATPLSPCNDEQVIGADSTGHGATTVASHPSDKHASDGLAAHADPAVQSADAAAAPAGAAQSHAGEDEPDILSAIKGHDCSNLKHLAENETIAPFFEFSADTWSTFAHNKRKVKLTEEELQKCLAFNDKISLEEVQRIYMPLSRLLHMYVRSRHDRSTVIQQFLGKSIESAPFIISISGSVACGKTTTANLLKHLISMWDTNPKVELITTDGFLLPNKVLHERHIEAKKGYPVSYDVKALMSFLQQLKNGEPNLKVPVYSHLYYDVMPGEYILVDRPDILILEGVNVLQNGADYPTIRNKVFISDFIDFSIYVDAEEDCLIKWYLDRFLKLRESTFNNPNSYFHRYAKLDLEDAMHLATTIWSAVNHDNLVENILPSRNRANLILHKGPNHTVDKVYLRK